MPELDSTYREEFIRHGMQDIVTLTHRNVCKDGFTVENLADAGMYSFCCLTATELDSLDTVFLDLPAPWDAVIHAKKALRVCSALLLFIPLAHACTERSAH